MRIDTAPLLTYGVLGVSLQKWRTVCHSFLVEVICKYLWFGLLRLSISPHHSHTVIVSHVTVTRFSKSFNAVELPQQNHGLPLYVFHITILSSRCGENDPLQILWHKTYWEVQLELIYSTSCLLTTPIDELHVKRRCNIHSSCRSNVKM